MKVVWRHRAEQQLRTQIAYIRRRNPSAADRMIARIRENLELLCDFPGIGRVSRRPGSRELVITDTPFIAVYRVVSDEITILRFFHGRQNR